MVLDFGTSQTPGSGTTPSNINGYFYNLAKSLNESMLLLVIIGVICAIGSIIILAIIIFYVKKKNSRQIGKMRKEDKLNFKGDELLKYESSYGYIDMIISYDTNRKILKIQNLIVGNISMIGNDIPDCYIKVFLKNQEGNKLHTKTTKTVDNNLSPSFPEEFSFNISELENCVIYFQLFDENKNGNDCLLGDGELHLEKIPRESYVGFSYSTYVILGPPSDVSGCGDVCVVISYKNQQIIVNVLEAKNLKFSYSQKTGKNIHNYPSVFALVKLYCNGHKKKTFKTRSKSNTQNPYFFESCSYNISLQEIRSCYLKIELHEFLQGRTAMRIGKSCIGNKQLNPLINELGQEHLNMVYNCPNTPYAMWHALIKG